MRQHYSDDEDPVRPGPDSGYLLVVEDNREALAYWHEDWKQLEDLTHALRLFQEIQEPPDWDVLLEGLRDLQPLRSAGRYPLLDYCDFDLWPFFMYLCHRNMWGAAHCVYFDENTPNTKTGTFLDECSMLLDRLRHYEPLRAFWEYMPR
jgi:hypothetical protein